MNKVSLKYIIAVLFGFCAGMLVCKFQPVFAEIDLSDERASMIADMNQQSEDIEQIQDVFGNDDLSEEDMTKILNGETESVIAKKEEAPKAAPKKGPIKAAAPVVAQPKVEPVKVKEPVQVALAPKEAPKEILIETPKAAPVVVVPVKEEKPVQVAIVPKEAPKAAPVEVVKVEPVVVQPKAEPVKEEKPVQVAMIPKETPKQEAIPVAPASPKQASVKKGPSKPVKKVSLKDLQSRLALTDAQVKRLTPIMKQKGDRRLEIIKKYAGKGESARPAFERDMQLFRQYYDDMYSHVMSDEQWNQYLQIREEQKNQASS
jgi:hypothetical protein